MVGKKVYRVRVQDWMYFETEEQMLGFVDLFEVEEFEAEECWLEEETDGTN